MQNFLNRNKMLKNNPLLLIATLIALEILFFKPVDALSITVHVPEKYTEVYAGERFYFEIEIKYPENPSRKDLRIEYEIKKEGEVIAQSKVLKAIETQASFVDFIVIPESAEAGMHVLEVKVSDYGNLSAEVSASFHIRSKKGEQIRLYFYILLGVILFVGGLILFEIHRLRESV